MPNFQRRERHLANWWRHPIKKRSRELFNCFVLGFLNFWPTPHSFRCFVGLEINWWQVFTMDPNHMIGPFGHPCRSQHTQTTDFCYRGDLATKVLKRRERRSPKVGTQNPACFLLKQKNIRFLFFFHGATNYFWKGSIVWEIWWIILYFFCFFLEGISQWNHWGFCCQSARGNWAKKLSLQCRRRCDALPRICVIMGLDA